MENAVTFKKGLRDGIPIGLGYLSVSFTFGMMAVNEGLPIWSAVLISATNLTSAGQFAGLSLILANGSFIEMALTQLIINLRYALMSLSLSQKLLPSITTPERMAIAFANTDEIFAVSSGQTGKLTKGYMFGLAMMPYLGWTGGTLIGAAASTILPEFIRSALGIAIYGMFIAIFIPPAKKQQSVRIVLAVAVLMSCLFTFLPVLSTVSSGFVIILCTIIAAALGAWLFPIEKGENDV